MSVLLFVVALAATSADETAAAVPAATEQAQPQKKAKERKICRTSEAVSSRMARRECKTEAEWAQQEAGATVGQLKNAGAR